MAVPLEPLALAVFDEKSDAWQRLAGKYTVAVGSSSGSLPLQEKTALY